MQVTGNPIELLLNDVFQVKSTGKIFQITFKDHYLVQFINIDDYENNVTGEKDKINTVRVKQFQKAYESGQFIIIANNLTRKK